MRILRRAGLPGALVAATALYVLVPGIAVSSTPAVTVDAMASAEAVTPATPAAGAGATLTVAVPLVAFPAEDGLPATLVAGVPVTLNIPVLATRGSGGASARVLLAGAAVAGCPALNLTEAATGWLRCTITPQAAGAATIELLARTGGGTALVQRYHHQVR